MYCSSCGKILQGNERICPVCGEPVRHMPMNGNGADGYYNGMPNVGSCMQYGSGYSTGQPFYGETGSPAAETEKQGFLHSVAGKAALAIAAVVLAGGAAIGVILYQGAKEQRKEPTEITEAVSETVTEEITTGTTENPTTVSTEATTEATTEEPVEYASLYLEILQEHETEIRAYEQYRVDLTAEDNSYDFLDSRPIAVCDITGDDVPELIYVIPQYVDGQLTPEDSALSIYTIENNTAKQIYYEEDWHLPFAAGGFRYCMFQIEGESALYAYNSVADIDAGGSYYRFDMKDNGELSKVEIMQWSGVLMTDEYAEYSGPETYSVNQKETDKDTFVSEENALVSRMCTNLIYNNFPCGREDAIRTYMQNAEYIAMTYEEAVALLSEETGAQDSGTDQAQFVGNWVIEYEPTESNNENDLFTQYGTGLTRYGSDMDLKNDGTGSWYVGIGNGGEGTWNIQNGTGTFDYISYETGESMSVDLTVEEIDGETYLVMDNNGYFLYWIKQDNQKNTSYPKDAFSYNGHHYYIYSEVCGYWEDAEWYCENVGGHLAIINDADENAQLYSYLRESGFKSAYFGFSDSTEEGVWTWVDGDTSDYTNWAPDEPNSENDGEDYAMFYYKYEDGTWNDDDFGFGDGGRCFICEWEY